MIKHFDITKDNKKIYGLLYLPKDINNSLESKNNKKYPLVILSHGLSLNHTYMKPYAQKLLKQGIPCYIFDFCGGGYDCKSSGKISDMSLQTEIHDLNMIVDTFQAVDVFDKIYLAGHSQGGFISSLVASLRKEDITALFLFAPAYVICDDVRNRNNMRQKSVLTLMPEHLGKTYYEGANNINLYDDISGYNKPVYIFHGKNDTRVPLTYSIKARKIYSNCELIIFDEEEHRFSDKTKKIVVDKIVKCIKDTAN